MTSISSQEDLGLGEENVDPYSTISDKKTWKIWTTSPLYNLQYSVIKMKQYAARLKMDIATAKAATPNMQYKASFNINKDVKASEGDPDGIQIHVLAKNLDSENENVYKLVYTALLFSWGEDKTTDDYATRLSFLFERGNESVAQIVRTTLSKIFDCAFSKAMFTQNQLILFATTLLKNETRGNERGIKFLYTQSEIDSHATFTIDCVIEDALRIWHSISQETSVVEMENQSFTFYEKLQRHIFEAGAIDISMLHLVEVQTPKGCFKHNGSIQVKDSEITKNILEILSESLLNSGFR